MKSRYAMLPVLHKRHSMLSVVTLKVVQWHENDYTSTMEFLLRQHWFPFFEEWPQNWINKPFVYEVQAPTCWNYKWKSALVDHQISLTLIMHEHSVIKDNFLQSSGEIGRNTAVKCSKTRQKSSQSAVKKSIGSWRVQKRAKLTFSINNSRTRVVLHPSVTEYCNENSKPAGAWPGAEKTISVIYFAILLELTTFCYLRPTLINSRKSPNMNFYKFHITHRNLPIELSNFQS